MRGYHECCAMTLALHLVCHHFRMPEHPALKRTCVALAACLPLLFASACSSEPTTQTATSGSPAATTADAGVAGKEAGNLGTRVCVINNTSLNASVTFPRKDTAQEGSIPPGGTKCAEGTYGVGSDVVGVISWDDSSWKTEFAASNPWIGSPKAGVYERSPDNTLMCTETSYGVNDSTSGDNGIVRVTMKRVADTDWKQFELTLAPSEKPSADGSRTAMKGFRKCSATLDKL